MYDVLEYLASGMTQEQILADFPDLESEDIQACLAYAADRERKFVSVPPAYSSSLTKISRHVQSLFYRPPFLNPLTFRMWVWPLVIWIHRGNCTTSEIAILLQTHQSGLLVFADNTERDFPE